MGNIQIETAQNVKIQQNIANVTDRITAFLFDLVVFIVYYFVVLIIVTSINSNFGNMGIYIGLLGLPIILYHLLFEYLMDGQSLGKKINSIKVVMLDGSRPSFVSFLLRWVFRIIDINLLFGSVGLLTILLNGKGQRLGDLVAGTTVIKIKKNHEVKKSIFEEIDEDYEPIYPQVTILSDKDIKKIKEIYKVARRSNNRNLLIKVVDKIKEITSIETEMDDARFIKTVIKDYHFLTRDM